MVINLALGLNEKILQLLNMDIEDPNTSRDYHLVMLSFKTYTTYLVVDSIDGVGLHDGGEVLCELGLEAAGPLVALLRSLVTHLPAHTPASHCRLRTALSVDNIPGMYIYVISHLT